jgi:hypothetical protein
LSGTQFSTLNSAGINDPEGTEKYNNTEVKSLLALGSHEASWKVNDYYGQ